jgi:cellulose synthase/poly-beta-1,6-N-acetylglucosamine synthase-like glycosyltransferase
VSQLESLLVLYSKAAFVYYVAFNAIYLLLMVLAWLQMRDEIRRRTYLGLDEAFRSPLTPGISVLVPAYNEAAVIVPSVRALLALRYPRHEVIVANDGSTDATIEVLTDAFDLVPVPLAVRDTVASAPFRTTYLSRHHPNLIVLDKENGGRSDALNAALRLARYPYVCVIDADSLLEEDALLKAAKPILDAPELLVATGGTIRIANGCRVDHGRVVDARLPRSRLAKMQVLEYLRAFLQARAAWSRLNALGLISGAFGLFHRPLVEQVGGYWTDTVGEDFELTLRLHRYLRDRDEPYRIAFVSDPVCWTEVPESFPTGAAAGSAGPGRGSTGTGACCSTPTTARSGCWRCRISLSSSSSARSSRSAGSSSPSPCSAWVCSRRRTSSGSSSSRSASRSCCRWRRCPSRSSATSATGAAARWPSWCCTP